MAISSVGAPTAVDPCAVKAAVHGYHCGTGLLRCELITNVGTALTVQTSLGFMLTLLTIQVIPPLVEAVGWEYVFMVLALGPAFGVWSMWQLRRLPEALRLASGHR